MKITMEPYTRYDSCLKPTFTLEEIWSGHFLYFNLHYHKHTQDEKSYLFGLRWFAWPFIWLRHRMQQ